MNIYILIAGILCIILGLVHSILGEFLIFKNKRKIGNLVPTKANKELPERHLRIIWATWHLSTFFGWCIGALLIKIALNQNKFDSELIGFMINSTIITMFSAALLVLLVTKGKHPGWIVLLLIVALLILGNYLEPTNMI
jgi:di/tricarboxylate transporter